jgi:hypothetical protein
MRGKKMKTTIKDLASYIGMTVGGIKKMKRDHPKKFDLMWRGWCDYLSEEARFSNGKFSRKSRQ